jgi:hypothetical protein
MSVYCDLQSQQPQLQDKETDNICLYVYSVCLFMCGLFNNFDSNSYYMTLRNDRMISE